MVTQYTSVILKATYIERSKQWSADEREVFQGEPSGRKEANQCEITIWSFACLAMLITIGTIFISQ
jgi:hypothetical protein